MDTKTLVKYGSIAAAISSIAGAAYGGFSWVDDRYAKVEQVIQMQNENCKKIEEIGLRQLQTEIFKLEIKQAEAQRSRSDRLANTPGNQWFSAVDEALLKRYKRDEKQIGERIKHCDQKK